MIAARIQANQGGRARAYHAQRYQRWCGMVAIKVPHNIFAGGKSCRALEMPRPVFLRQQPSIHTPSCLVPLRLPRLPFADGVFMYLYKKFPTCTSHRVVDARGPSGRSASGATRYAGDHQGGLRRLSDEFARRSLTQNVHRWSKHVFTHCHFWFTNVRSQPQISLAKIGLAPLPRYLLVCVSLH